MIDGKDLNRCIDILSELNANAASRKEKQLILELGYIIKQELDLVNLWEQNHNNSIRGRERIDVNKLLEDNAQLYKENQTLLKNFDKLKAIIETKLPSIQTDLTEIKNEFNVLNNHIENNLGNYEVK